MTASSADDGEPPGREGAHALHRRRDGEEAKPVSSTAFTRADRYVVQVHAPLPYPLRQLALATALTADLALKQDACGLG